MTDQPVPFSAKFRPFAYGLILGGLLGGVGAGYVWFDARGQLIAAQQQAETATATANEANKALQADLDKAQARGKVQAARIALDTAQLELGRENFGLATDAVQRAGRLLGDVDAAKAGIDANELGAVTGAVQSANLRSGLDALARNELVLELERKVDALLEQ